LLSIDFANAATIDKSIECASRALPLQSAVFCHTNVSAAAETTRRSVLILC